MRNATHRTGPLTHLAGMAGGFLLALVAAASAANPPVIRLSESQVDFGSLKQNDVVSREIRVSNTGGEPLIVSDVHVSCPCTEAEIAEETVPPGGSTILTIRINSRDYQGLIDKRVEIACNDPQRANLEISVKAFIRAPILYEPNERSFDFGELPRGSGAPKTVHFQTRELSSLKIEALEYNAALFSLSIGPGSDAKHAVLTLDLRPDAPVGSFRELIRLGTNDPGQPKLDFEARGTVLGGLSAEPDPVNFRFVEEGQALSQEILVKCAVPGGSFRLTGAQIDLPGLEAKVAADGASGEGRVLVSGKAVAKDDPQAKQSRGRLRGTLRILTDQADQPQIEVDIIYLLRI